MNASPDAVWALVSDVTRIGEFSPETFEAEWLGGASGPVTGAKFRGHVKRNEKGPVYWTVCRVSACTPEQVFEFQVMAGSKVVNTWRYDLAAADRGTDVTESFRLASNPISALYGATVGRLRTRRNVNDMRRTLERVKAVVEAA